MPPKRTVVTLAEKKARILRFFQDQHDIYSIKDLEKLIPKKCAGVSSMLVKDLVQQLIDEDGIISVEKCGNVNVYWCFKNQMVSKMYSEMQQLQGKIEEAKSSFETLKGEVNVQRVQKRCSKFKHNGKTYHREKLLAEYERVNKELGAVQKAHRNILETKWDEAKLKAYPERIKRKLDQVEKITDNIEVIVSFLMRRHGVSRSELAAAIGMPDEFSEFDEIRQSMV